MSGGRRAGDQHAALLTLLADGQWHDYDRVLTRVAATVTPGAALRHVEAARAARSLRQHGEVRPRAREVSFESQVRTGSRQIVRALMASASFEVEAAHSSPPGSGRRVRLRPVSASGGDGSPDGHGAPLVAALTLLADGSWLPYEVVLARAAAEVDEDRALRYAEAHSRSSVGAQFSYRRALAAGRRGVAHQALIRAKVLEVVVEDGRSGRAGRRVRLRP